MTKRTRTTTGETWSYTWDLQNRLTKVEQSLASGQPNAEMARYTYDIRGLRVAATKNNVTTYYQYDQSGDLVWMEKGTQNTKYIQVLGQVWAEVQTNAGVSKRYYHHTDYEGTTNVVTDSDGKVVWDGEYEAFGALVRENGTLDFTPSYTGKQLDEETGLYYYNARWYDAELGRFISEDPIRSGENWEIYALANPLRYLDPTGLQDQNWLMGLLKYNLPSFGPRVPNPNYELANKAISATNDFSDGLVKGEFSGKTSAAAQTGKYLSNLTTAGSARDAFADLLKGQYAEFGTNVAGAIPFVGPAAKSGKTVKIAEDLAKTTEKAASETSVDIALKYKTGWTESQRAAADLKVRALTEADTVVTSVPKRGTAQGLFRTKEGLDSAFDADHIIDLQLGGKDLLSNLWKLDKSVNRSLGPQIQNQIKGLPLGTKIGKVTIGD